MRSRRFSLGMMALLIQSSSTVALAENITCSAAWTFPAGDKSYTGVSPDQNRAIQAATAECIEEQVLAASKGICSSAPHGVRCRADGPLPPPPTPPFTPAWCVAPKDPTDAVRIRALSKIGTPMQITPSNNGWSCVSIAKTDTISKTYCNLRDAYGEAWCTDTPYDPAGCQYWAWTLPNHPYPNSRVNMVGENWQICVSVFNQSGNRRRDWQIYAE